MKDFKLKKTESGPFGIRYSVFYKDKIVDTLLRRGSFWISENYKFLSLKRNLAFIKSAIQYNKEHN